MKPTSIVRAQLLKCLAELEHGNAGHTEPKQKPVITIDMTKVPSVSAERWESLDKAAKDPAIKLRGQAIVSLD